MGGKKKEKRVLDGGVTNKNLPQILVAPSMLLIMGVMIVPIIYSLVLSLSSLSLKTQDMSFTGLANYRAMLQNMDFWRSLGLTVLFTVITVGLEVCLGVAIALVLDKEFKGRGFVRGLMILPWALPGVVSAIMWKWIFNANYGPMNALLSQLGIISKYQQWLAKPVSAFCCVVFADIWKETPYVVLLTIAALANISKDLYEAAECDGANPWKTFWKITLPLIVPVLVVLVITKTIWALQTYDLIYIMTAGGPISATEFITLYIQRTAFKYQRFGPASAMSYSLSIICFILTYRYIRLFMNEEMAGAGPSRKERKLTKKQGGNASGDGGMKGEEVPA